MLVVKEANREEVDGAYRRFADFFVLDNDGEPCEEWGVYTTERWLPERFFRTLLRFFKLVGLHFHGAGEWTIDEGLKEAALWRLRSKLSKLPTEVLLVRLGG